MSDTVGAVLRQARIGRGLSQVEVAVAAGVSRPTVARIEAGLDVSMSSVRKVAEVFGLTPGFVPQAPSVKGGN